jgi:dihydrofolate synthase/folylpolyglutamate synthase
VRDVASSYALALERIYSLDRFGSQLGLERIGAILKELGSPQKGYRCVLVGGSNGKGSTTEMIGAIMKEEGLRVGTYFSPQIEEFAERMRISGRNAGKREIAAAYVEVAAAAKKVAPGATFFEIVTAMALVMFAQRRVDCAVLEVGLGGRLDATNAVEPEVSAITSVSLEHADVLGRTIAAIAREKCGIARKGKLLVCGKMSDEAREALRKECGKIGAKLKFANPSRLPALPAAPGEFQLSNAAVAAEVCRALGVGEGAIAAGLRSCRPKYRLERRGSLLLDCAHNPEAAQALANEVAGIRVRGKKVLLFSAMEDKDYAGVLHALAPQFDEAVVTEVRLARGEGAERLAEAAKKAGIAPVIEKNAKAALALARKLVGKNGLAVVAGSIYLLAELYSKDKIRLAQ